MIVVDVNLLLYATVDGFPHHELARSWWESALSGTRQIGLADPVIFGFVRIATNPRIVSPPLSVPAAVGTVRDWLAQPTVRVLRPGIDHLDVVLELLTDAGTARNLTTDAQIAALAIEHRAEVFSTDTDFGRFPRVAWTNPLL